MGIEFITPDFISENSPEEIHARMMKSLPEDIDKMPGGFPYDFTMPSALEKSELIQFQLVRTLMLMFPQYAWGEWLDLHGQQAGVFRKDAGYAEGTVTFQGIVGTRIPEQTVVCTAADAIGPSVEYVVTMEGIVPESGILSLPVTAVLAGTLSNVAAGTVTLFAKPLQGITKLWNEAAITGGVEAEEDEAYRQRILEWNENKDTSFVGNNGDYIRWAKELVGVGSASVIPEWDGAGTVKLIIRDSNGMAANDMLIKKVYDYIMMPDRPTERKAPIGAILTVAAPVEVTLNFSCSLLLAPDACLAEVEAGFLAQLERYYQQAGKEGIIRYTKVTSLLSGVDGVEDFTGFLINGMAENIILRQEDYPVTGTLSFSVKEVESGNVL